MKVLSLFDGMSCGQIALNKIGLKPEKYFASEIKTHAIKVTQENFPSTIQIGDVQFVTKETFGINKIDLLIGGTPCQDLSIINHGGKGLKGSKSSLFYEYVRILNELKPKYFLLENVASMKNIDKSIITETLGVKPILINSDTVSAQHRRRLYWTNIPGIQEIKDKNILLKDIIDPFAKPEEKMSEKKKSFIQRKRNGTMYVRVDGEKSMPITARGYAAWNTQFVTRANGEITDLTLKEYKKLQTIPLDYKIDLIKSKATDLIGDGWTIDVICHLLKPLKKLIK